MHHRLPVLRIIVIDGWQVGLQHVNPCQPPEPIHLSLRVSDAFTVVRLLPRLQWSLVERRLHNEVGPLDATHLTKDSVTDHLELESECPPVGG